MSLAAIVRALGGDLYAGGRRANVPAPGHSAADRSVSLMWVDGRVIVHSFGASSWQEVRDALRARGLIDAAGAVSGASARAAPAAAPSPTTRRAVARALWEAAAPLRTGTPAFRYCARRGVDTGAGASAALRGHPAAPLSVYRPGRATRPALLAAIRDLEGALTAVEITYLEPSGRRAQALRLPRKTVGVLPPGAAVRLAPAAERLLVAEGVFTALSAAVRFGLPGWALLSTSNLRRWIPPPCVRGVLIAADRGRDGEASAAGLGRRLRAAGLGVEIVLPPAGFGDWNEAEAAQREPEEGMEAVRGRRGGPVRRAPETRP